MCFISHNTEQSAVFMVFFTTKYSTECFPQKVCQNVIELPLFCVCPIVHEVSKSFTCKVLYFNADHF